MRSRCRPDRATRPCSKPEAVGSVRGAALDSSSKRSLVPAAAVERLQEVSARRQPGKHLQPVEGVGLAAAVAPDEHGHAVQPHRRSIAEGLELGEAKLHQARSHVSHRSDYMGRQRARRRPTAGPSPSSARLSIAEMSSVALTSGKVRNLARKRLACVRDQPGERYSRNGCSGAYACGVADAPAQVGGVLAGRRAELAAVLPAEL